MRRARCYRAFALFFGRFLSPNGFVQFRIAVTEDTTLSSDP